jgi:hypothetical protein
MRTGHTGHRGLRELDQLRQLLVEGSQVELVAQPVQTGPGNLGPVGDRRLRGRVSEVSADQVGADNVVSKQDMAGPVGQQHGAVGIDDHSRERQVGLQQPVNRGQVRGQIPGVQVGVRICGR